MSDGAEPAPARTGAPRRTWRAVLSLVALVLAPFSWWWTVDQPLLRATGLTAWALLAVAVWLAASAARVDRRVWVRGVALLQLAAAAFALWAYFVHSRLPVAVTPERAPDFTLPDQDGRPVTLARELAAGPVLLVFYRGHW